jgi:hypothetical protein
MEKFLISQRFSSYFCTFQQYYFYSNSNWCDSPFKPKTVNIVNTKFTISLYSFTCYMYILPNKFYNSTELMVIIEV